MQSTKSSQYALKPHVFCLLNRPTFQGVFLFLLPVPPPTQFITGFHRIHTVYSQFVMFLISLRVFS